MWKPPQQGAKAAKTAAPAATDTTAKTEAPADTAKADSAAAVAAAPAADTTAAAAPADTAKAEQKAESNSEPRTAGQTIMENPLEFIVVSAAFIASVLVIIFTGKD